MQRDALQHLWLFSYYLYFLFPVPQGPIPEGHLPLPLLLAVVAVIVVLGMILTCGSLSISKKHSLSPFDLAFRN